MLVYLMLACGAVVSHLTFSCGQRHEWKPGRVLREAEKEGEVVVHGPLRESGGELMYNI